MPHAKILVQQPFADIVKCFEIEENEIQGCIVKILDVYRSVKHDRALLLCLVAEPRVTYRFYVELLRNAESEILIRLDRSTDPEKTDGVLLLLCSLISRILNLTSESKLIKTNIPVRMLQSMGIQQYKDSERGDEETNGKGII